MYAQSESVSCAPGATDSEPRPYESGSIVTGRPDVYLLRYTHGCVLVLGIDTTRFKSSKISQTRNASTFVELFRMEMVQLYLRVVVYLLT